MSPVTSPQQLTVTTNFSGAAATAQLTMMFLNYSCIQQKNFAISKYFLMVHDHH